jgi:hypothetical protein
VKPILLDHGDNIKRHDFPTIDRRWSLAEKPAPKGKSREHKLCKACFAYIAANASACPLCGFALPKPEPKERTQEDGRPLELARQQTERDAYDQLVQKARARGFKPGFASAQWKEKFGKWPPWAWSQETKKQFADDLHWQERLEIRSAERERWKAIDDRRRAADLAAAATPESANAIEAAHADELAADDAPFADWLAEQGITGSPFDDRGGAS